MTLEDFFTLTEIKDGLTAPSRVEELVSVMQKEKDYVLKNAGDAIRQWAAVASTIVATENKECLELFVQLDGLSFIDRWIRDANKFENDATDSFVEESITVLLRALEKLHVDGERSISSGIWTTIKNLLGHQSTKVQDYARTLFDRWTQNDNGGKCCHDVANAMPCDNGAKEVGNLLRESGDSGSSDAKVSSSHVGGNSEVLTVEPAGHEALPSRSPSCLQEQKVEDDQIQKSGDQLSPQKILDDANAKDRSLDPVTSSPVLNPSHETNEDVKESSVCPVEVTTVEMSGHSVPLDGGGQMGKIETSKMPDIGKQEDKISIPHDKLGTTTKSAFNAFELTAVSLELDATTATAHASVPKVPAEDDININSFRAGNVALGLRRTASEVKSEKNDKGILGQCSTVLKTVQSTSSSTVQKPSGNECSTGKPNDLEVSFSRTEDRRSAEPDKEHSSDRGEDLAGASNSFRLSMEVRGPSRADRRRSTMDLEYGIIDAIEVARQVAQEVEREVNSDRDSDGGIRKRGSPQSINGKHDLSAEVPPDEVPPRQSSMSEASSDGEGSLINPDNQNAELDDSMHEMESSQVTEATQEPEDKTVRGMCVFDLNEEVCSEELDCAANAVSTPVSVVSATKPAVTASGLPSAPLQFEGSLGWKGSAARSAFRPASPRRSNVAEKTLQNEESNDSKQRHTYLNIDLNVAEGGDDKIANLMPGMQIPVSSSLRSGESSVEVSSKRSERLKLDLNRVGDDEPSTSDLRAEHQVFYNRSGQRSPSPASSSSTMRNFDLNDRPLIYNDFSDQVNYNSKSSQYVTPYGNLKSEPVISILGTKVEVNKKEQAPQSLSLLNGKALETSADANMARAGGFCGMGPAISYPHAWTFNGVNAGPAGSISSAMYRPGNSFPYMVDSRGTPIIPQHVGSVSPVLTSYPQTPFMVNMMTGPLGLNGPGPSRLQFDLNSGFPVDAVSHEPAGLRQFLLPDQGRSVEEHMRVGLQPSSSTGFSGKRKEPEGGWEPYPLGFRQQPPPWR